MRKSVQTGTDSSSESVPVCLCSVFTRSLFQGVCQQPLQCIKLKSCTPLGTCACTRVGSCHHTQLAMAVVLRDQSP